MESILNLKKETAPYKVKAHIALEIDKAIHDITLSHITLLNEYGEYGEYPIKTHPFGMRFIEYNGIMFMEQNKAKLSLYGKLANKGAKITWGIRPGSWIYILDHKIIRH